MPDVLEFSIDGMGDLRNRLNDLPARIFQEVDAELLDGVNAIAAEARQRAPADDGILRNQIVVQNNGNMNYSVAALPLYAPYVEFGTREKVDIPPGLEEYAAQFKGDFASGTYSEGGSALTAKEAIFEWCKHKGIDQNLWYPIYASIMIHGINPHPFFFPAVNRILPIITDRIQKVVAKAL